MYIISWMATIYEIVNYYSQKTAIVYLEMLKLLNSLVLGLLSFLCPWCCWVSSEQGYYHCFRMVKEWSGAECCNAVMTEWNIFFFFDAYHTCTCNILYSASSKYNTPEPLKWWFLCRSWSIVLPALKIINPIKHHGNNSIIF